MMPRVDGRPEPLPLPGGLSPDAAQVWRAITESLPAEHFRPSDVPLLASYCETTATANRAAQEIAANGAVVAGKASPWLVVQEKAIRAQATLALRLRLCPSARQDPKSAGRERVSRPSPPWLTGVPDDADA
jgi:phage terminase small subunit